MTLAVNLCTKYQSTSWYWMKQFVTTWNKVFWLSYKVISVRWTRYSVPSVMSSLPGCEICSLRRRIFPLCSCGAWEERLVLWDTFLSGAGFHSRRWRRWISGSAHGDHNKIPHHLPPLTWNQDQINPRTILQSSGISSLTFWQVLWCGSPGECFFYHWFVLAVQVSSSQGAPGVADDDAICG